MNKTAHERVQIARHPERPYSLDLFSTIFDDFIEIHGDRRYADDPAMVCGFAKLADIDVCVIGQQKGRDMKSRQYRNFAMSKPEGYRKALRLMQLAEKFSRPIITIIDTPGAYPGIDAEERGQAEAIAYNLKEMAKLKVPIICLVLGEGGSGGALAIGIGNVVLMMENAVYSVITPEGCAAILWKDASQAPRASEGLKLTANELKKFSIIDEVIPEFDDWKMPFEVDTDKTTQNLKKILLNYLTDLNNKSEIQLIGQRFQKFRKMCDWIS
ncbi:MAG: acetyl-CoA carboxylase carboxyltransferase subunit alpha [Pyrinomonadaceae bacterium]|jgi:acetyl-CoA carboxylase carboxyl transferase subunit alpha|nr:acetyl-CoA carboxylase carboxyltransferase subunit alpha [Pyrinomonadaceae bacterium]